MAKKNFTVSNDSGGPVVINDLGAISIADETTDLNLFPDNYSLEMLRDSADLRAAIEAGTITAKLGNANLTSGLLFDTYMFDYLQEEIDDIEGEKTITHIVGSSRATISQDLERTKEGTTTAETPYDAPFSPVSYLREAIISSKKNDNETYDIKVLIEDVVVKTFSVTNSTGVIERDITGISADSGEKIRYCIEQNGATAFDVRKLECEFIWANRTV